ncbi:MAG: 1,4-dihydroxy-6-naphthoate synthase [Planctomycetaceae bacterium]|nr:1,4-dihydroxy-6-naphthoate synthase [Planctomycetaceae bacterium]
MPPLNLTIAYSPCPNDMFVFHDLASGTLRLHGCQLQVSLHDVQTLNELAQDARYDVTKLSLPAYLRVRSKYQMLRSGAAMGFGCGPVVVAARAIARDDLASCRVAIPGELTTAHLLFQLWAPRVAETLFVRYDKIMDLVAAGQVDAGVIIHESRFVYPSKGLGLVVDLGQWWQDQTGLPVPLACIAARRTLGQETIAAFDSLLQEAVENSMSHPEATLPYVAQSATEMDEAVLRKHIATFVNDYTLNIGPDGHEAVRRLEAMAQAAGLLP